MAMAILGIAVDTKDLPTTLICRKSVKEPQSSVLNVVFVHPTDRLTRDKYA